MKTLRKRPKAAAFPRLAVVLSIALVSLTTLPAGEANGSASKSSPRPSLTIKVDADPIDRNAPDRVSYAPIVEPTAASVVFVYSTREATAAQMAPFLNDPIMRRFFGVPGGPGSAPPTQPEHGLGSGVIVSPDGYILTNNHVIEGADDVKVSIGESLQRYDATVVGTDALADIAVLKINAEKLVPATLGDSDQLKVGDVVLAIGNPFGVGQSVSRGIVSALSRGNLGIEQIEDFIQTDAAINMGNSGGALIDSRGRVIGINTAILSRTGGFAGVGFAIPINLVRNIAEQIVKTGSVSRGFLGVAPQALTPELATQFGTHRGALIAEVTPGGPAEKAGLRTGDIITKVNEVAVVDPRQLLLAVSQLQPGTSTKIEYLREGKTGTAQAQLDRRPGETMTGRVDGRGPGGSSPALDGIAVVDLTPQVREQLKIPERVQGALIAQIDPTSAAAAQGLQQGDVIMELGRKPVRSAEDVARLSEQVDGNRLMALIWREGRTQFVVIEAQPQPAARR